MKYAKGVCWVDDTRIPFVDSDKETINFDRPRIREKKDWVYELGTTWENPDVKEYNTQGRFTPSLLVCDDMLNDGSVSKSTKVKSPLLDITGGSYNNAKGNTNKITERGVDDKGTNSRYYDLDKWFDKVINNL